MSISTIKAQIAVNLANLVTDGVLAGYTTTDLKHDPLKADIPNYPHAYLMPPAVASNVLDNRSVLRTYTFDIVVMQNAENITTSDELETLVENMMNEFDNDPTLGGTALGGVLPVSSSPQPYQHSGKDLVMFILRIEAKADVSLSFA
jgi:hypothetical protein